MSDGGDLGGDGYPATPKFVATSGRRPPAASPRPRLGMLRPMAGPLHDVRDHVVSMIVAGELLPGAALPAERELAIRLGVSRPLVREALRSLEAVNIVESRRGAGTYVTDLTPELLLAPLTYAFRLVHGSYLDLFQVRRFLEPAAAAEAASTVKEDSLVEMDELLKALDEPDEDTFPENDLAFHEWIVRQTGNPLLLSIIRGIRDLEFTVLEVTAANTVNREQSQIEHRAIGKAIREGDPERAKAAMLLHLARVEDQVRSAGTERPASAGEAH
ncbi:FadR/GntR family transcriptional regulator [Saccharopolyspora hattusasensis]|uniref:FadR/GntR family transcriptional regulator n=1 Tax=Saccharopolyspora hattusasensis TaxID=1128679 RepID=UPI003D97DD2A